MRRENREEGKLEEEGDDGQGGKGEKKRESWRRLEIKNEERKNRMEED